jgi:UDP-N-acetylmuramoyl-L-alanyl-D-glutamate--2,6-diaminopimelate ligase
MLLGRLIDALPLADVAGPTDIEIRDIVYDSRQVTPGTLFVAVPSVGGDDASGGYQHLDEAVGQGAVAVLVHADFHSEHATTIRVPSARAALADLAAAFFDYPSRKLRLYAITGTDGKTTTSYLLEQIFTSAAYLTGMIGTVEHKIGEKRTSNLDRTTTPESLDMQRLLRQMVDAGVTHAVTEASSHALVLERLRGCYFAGCALTNITTDHLEFHGSWDAYFAAKAALFTELSREGPAVLNRDDRHFARLTGMFSGPVLTYGTNAGADVRGTDIQELAGGSRFMLQTGEGRAEAKLSLLGAFNVSNALAAAGLALTAGMSPKAIAQGLSAAQPPPGRLQRVSAGQPFDVLVDYAHTMHAFESVLASLRERTPHPRRLIAVFGAAGDRDRAKRPVLARIVRDFADFFVITNEDPFGEHPDAIVDEIAAELPREERGTRFERELDRTVAIRMALSRARPGDTVVILGKGHEQSIVVNGHRQPWSDVDVIRRVLEGIR